MIIKSPLTDIQKGILFEIKRFKGRSYYINQELLHFKTAIDVPLMRKAFIQLVEKHEVLRSYVVFESYHPQLTIHTDVDLPFELHDYSSFDDDRKRQYFDSFLEKDFNQSLDVTIAPLMRISMFKFAEDDYRIVWDIHHIIADGASISRIIKELLAIYSALIKNDTYIADESDSCNEIDSYKPEVEIDEASKYWKKLLSNHEFSSFLPCNHKNRAHLGKKISSTKYLSNKDYQQIIDFSRSNSLTINALLQASWAIALSHYSNNKNIIFGSVRAYPKDVTKSSAGLFINTLPMSVNIDFNSTVIDYLHKIRKQGKKLRDYVTVPLNQIQEWSGLPPDTAVYQSIINYEPFSLNKTLKSCFPELHCEFSSKLDVPYPLILEVIDDEESLQLDLHYDEELFDNEYMESFLNHYKDILLQIVSSPNKKLLELPVADEVTLQKVVVDWNNTGADYPMDKTIHQLFEEQVEKTPDAPAVIFKEDTLSFRLLNEKANQLAHHLLQHNLSLEDPVVIWLETRVEMLVSILAVLKAGGAYVPIDSNNPPERTNLILQDSKPKIIITETEYLKATNDSVDTFSKKPLIINIDQPKWEGCSKNNPSKLVQSSNLMYVIYTSGSTGKPKGSLIEHFSIANMALSCAQRLKVDSTSRVLQIASFSFDVSVVEWCMTLLSGASLYLIEKDVFSPQKIVHALNQHKITTIILAHSILAALPEVELPYLKVIAPGGEPLSDRTLNYWAKKCLLLNVYGITETSVCSTMADCTPGKDPITVGKPLANVQIYVLNKQLQPLPPGVVGEIHVGGCGVGRGYLNKPKLTQEKFITDFFGANLPEFIDRQGTLYKTGDLGRWTKDGELEFIGRLDDQVKVRGFRIETTEISHILEQYPVIEKAIVLTTEVGANKQLMAYVLPKTTRIIDTMRLQVYLNSRLPSYMIPAQIVQIDELPLTEHGKIDKKRLLAMHNYVIPGAHTDTFSKNCEITEKICAIIRKMLQRQDVPTYKNFLDIGLDSIMLVGLSMKLSSEFNQEIDITTLFTYTTIDKLVDFIQSNKSASDKTNDSFASIKEFIRKRKKF